MQDWEERKTEETRSIEDVFRTDFPRTDAYRFNSASIRLRVIDDRFEGKSIAEREAMVLPLLKKIPKKTRDDILLLLMLTPSEQRSSSSQTLMNMEFEQPLPSRLWNDTTLATVPGRYSQTSDPKPDGIVMAHLDDETERCDGP